MAGPEGPADLERLSRRKIPDTAGAANILTSQGGGPAGSPVARSGGDPAGLRNPTHPVSDSDNIRSRATIIWSPRDIAAERGLVMSPWTGSVKLFGRGAAGAVCGAARAL